MIKEVEEGKEVKEVEELQVAQRTRQPAYGFDARASQATSDASFSSCVQGAPRGRPSSAMRRVRTIGFSRSASDASFRSSRSLEAWLASPQRVLACSSALRKSSPSAVWIRACDTRICGRLGSGRPDARTKPQCVRR